MPKPARPETGKLRNCEIRVERPEEIRGKKRGYENSEKRKQRTANALVRRSHFAETLGVEMLTPLRPPARRPRERRRKDKKVLGNWNDQASNKRKGGRETRKQGSKEIGEKGKEEDRGRHTFRRLGARVRTLGEPEGCLPLSRPSSPDTRNRRKKELGY